MMLKIKKRRTGAKVLIILMLLTVFNLEKLNNNVYAEPVTLTAGLTYLVLGLLASYGVYENRENISSSLWALEQSIDDDVKSLMNGETLSRYGREIALSASQIIMLKYLNAKVEGDTPTASSLGVTQEELDYAVTHIDPIISDGQLTYEELYAKRFGFAELSHAGLELLDVPTQTYEEHATDGELLVVPNSYGNTIVMSTPSKELMSLGLKTPHTFRSGFEKSSPTSSSYEYVIEVKNTVTGISFYATRWFKALSDDTPLVLVGNGQFGITENSGISFLKSVNISTTVDGALTGSGFDEFKALFDEHFPDATGIFTADGIKAEILNTPTAVTATLGMDQPTAINPPIIDLSIASQNVNGTDESVIDSLLNMQIGSAINPTTVIVIGSTGVYDLSKWSIDTGSSKDNGYIHLVNHNWDGSKCDFANTVIDDVKANTEYVVILNVLNETLTNDDWFAVYPANHLATEQEFNIPVSIGEQRVLVNTRAELNDIQQKIELKITGNIDGEYVDFIPIGVFEHTTANFPNDWATDAIPGSLPDVSTNTGTWDSTDVTEAINDQTGVIEQIYNFLTGTPPNTEETEVDINLYKIPEFFKLLILILIALLLYMLKLFQFIIALRNVQMTTSMLNENIIAVINFIRAYEIVDGLSIHVMISGAFTLFTAIYLAKVIEKKIRTIS